MNEEGLIFSGLVTQPKAELWIKNMEDHFGEKWFQGSTRFKMLFSILPRVLQPGGKYIKPYKDATEQKGIQEDSIEILSYPETLW